MRSRWIIAAVLALVGIVWIGQGTGVIRGSGFMTDDIRWAVVGVVLLVAGLIVAWTAVRSRPRT
jgi:lipopolysaccharide export system protein LptC